MIVYACLTGPVGALIAGTFICATPMNWRLPRNQIVQVGVFALMSA